MTKSSQALLLTAVSFGALSAAGGAARAQFKQTDLVSDISGLAEVTDSNLKNSWGLSHLPGSPFWVSNQGTNTATLYSVTGATASKVPLTVAIPTTVPPVEGPTGQVANPGAGFDVTGTGKSALFIFANLNGSISAWNQSAGTTAVTERTTPGASYTGLAINAGGTMLYAANAAAGKIDVFSSSFAPATVAGSFVDPDLPSGYVPFNVEDMSGKVYVTYALAGHPAETNATAGEGAVAVFDESGNFEQQLVGVSKSGELASPWGMAIAPAGFGPFGGDLLVGNFSDLDSGIEAFNPTNGMFEGMISVDPGAGDSAGGLWSLAFGGGPEDGSPNVLYFTDGINGEKDGLFAALTVPEPSTWAMMLLGFGGLALLAARRRRAASAI